MDRSLRIASSSAKSLGVKRPPLPKRMMSSILDGAEALAMLSPRPISLSVIVGDLLVVRQSDD
jgi:hypothetical protein